MTLLLLNKDRAFFSYLKNLISCCLLFFFLIFCWSFFTAPAYCMQSDAEIVRSTKSLAKNIEILSDFQKIVSDILIQFVGPDSALYTSFASQVNTSSTQSLQSNQAFQAFSNLINDWLNQNHGFDNDQDDPNKPPSWFNLVKSHYEILPRAWIDSYSFLFCKIILK